MSVRGIFVRSLFQGLHILWPVLSAILLFVAGLGVIIGLVEGWGVWPGVYFAFVTALTIGYGDLVPSGPLTQALALVAGFAGITLTALLAGVTVRAFQVTPRATDPGKER